MTEDFTQNSQRTFDLHEEQLLVNMDRHKRSIVETRQAIQLLHSFSTSSKKQKSSMSFALIWNALVCLAKITGSAQSLLTVSEFHLPHHLLIAEIAAQGIFEIKNYSSHNVFDNRKSDLKKYFVLLQGALQKQVSRTSLARDSRRSRLLDISLKESSTQMLRSTVNNNRIIRTPDQMPICINIGCQSQEQLNVTFKAISSVRMLEINLTAWKNFQQRLTNLQQQYIMDFIRSKLGVNFNTEKPKVANLQNTEEKQKIETEKNNTDVATQETPMQDQRFFEVQIVERKKILPMQRSHVYLVYLGQVLITSQYYRVQATQGCILNSEIINLMENKVLSQQLPTAFAITQTLIIKINLQKIMQFFVLRAEQGLKFKLFLQKLQKSRHSTKDQQLYRVFKSSQSKNKINIPTKQTKSKEKSADASYCGVKTDPKEVKYYNTKLKQFQAIQRRVQNSARAAQIKMQSNQVSVSPNKDDRSQDMLSMSPREALPQQILKNCMSSIELKSQMLKQAVKENRSKRKKIAAKNHLQPIQSKISSVQKPLFKQSPVAALHKRLKYMHVKTEQTEKLRYYRFGHQIENKQIRKSNYRDTVNFPLVMGGNQFSQKQMFSGHQFLGGVKSVMKKLPNGKVRAARLF